VEKHLECQIVASGRFDLEGWKWGADSNLGGEMGSFPTHVYDSISDSALDKATRVSELIDHDSNWWNVALVESIFLADEAGKICGMAICPRLQTDKLI
jgi:hypothetical protein